MKDSVHIVWQRWIDPFKAAVAEHKERGWIDTYEYLDRPGQMGVYQGPIMIGPGGIVPLNELNCPSKNFDLWVGHTSFNLSAPLASKMMKVSGVEIFKLWTRYRFWVGVGRAFDSCVVKKKITQIAKKHFSPVRPRVSPPIDCVGLLRQEISAQYPHWAIFVLPSGKLDVFGSPRQEEVRLRVEEMAGRARSVLTSWSENDERHDEGE